MVDEVNGAAAALRIVGCTDDAPWFEQNDADGRRPSFDDLPVHGDTVIDGIDPDRKRFDESAVDSNGAFFDESFTSSSRGDAR